VALLHDSTARVMWLHESICDLPLGNVLRRLPGSKARSCVFSVK
jgi:hypothetical protein